MQTYVPEATPVPNPHDWARLHSLLTRAWAAKQDKRIPKPPVPLVLAGAAFSTAEAIRRRWRDMVAWANEHGFAPVLLAHLPPLPDGDVAEKIAGVSADGRAWWPEYGEQHHPARPKPSKQALA